MKIKLRVLFALMLLLPYFHCLNWQGTGVMPSEMMGAIWNSINSNFDPSKALSEVANFDGDTTLVDFATRMSTDLNSQFDRGWNVVINYIRFGSNSDAVLYGYAFREHWFWYNGFKMNDANYVAFIIWKDYNCQTYITYNTNETPLSTTYPTEMLSTLNSFFSSQAQNWQWSDHWTAAFSLVENLQKQTIFPSGSAFSVILSQSANANYFGYVCALHYIAKNTPASNGKATGGPSNFWGNFILFQMR